MFNKNEWYQNSFTEWNKFIANSESLKIAIARKAPRMFEYQVQCKHLPEDVLDTVISEHALPFMMAYQGPVSVIDDAIYYGTTFENVLTFVKTSRFITGQPPLTKETLKAYPVIRAQKAKMLYNIDLNHVQVAEEENIPYYIEHLATDFLELGKPFDVEFPIFYLHNRKEGEKDIPNEEKSTRYKELCERVRVALQETFPECEVYPIEHITNTQEVKYNYSVLFSSSLRSSGDHTEFAKFRLFVNEDRISLTAYSPAILNEDILTEDSPLFKDTVFEDLWKEAFVKPISEYKESNTNSYIEYLNLNHKVKEINQLQWEYQVEECEYIRKRSLIILANYLHSYSLILRNKEQIKAFSERINYQIKGVKKFDLQLLVGLDLAQNFANKLNDLYIVYSAENNKLPSESTPNTDFISYFSRSILPEEYAKEYNWENDKDWSGSENLAEALSCMFTNMHLYIEKASRGNFPDDVRRLRFGDSYDSLFQELNNKVNKPSIQVDLLPIHKWIDKKIDEGSVVPKYDRILYYNNFCWHRLFRAGENEDRFAGQLIRIFIFIFDKIQSQLNTDHIEKNLIENIFSVLFSKNNFTNISSKKTLGKIKWNEPSWEGSCYQVSFNNELDSKPTFLFDYLYRMQIVGKEDNYTQFITLLNTRLVNEYRKGTTLDSKIEEEIATSISILISLLKEESFENRTGIINRLMEAEKYIDNEALMRIKNVQLNVFFDKTEMSSTFNLKEDSDFRKMKEELNRLFLSSYRVSHKYMQDKTTKVFNKLFEGVPEDVQKKEKKKYFSALKEETKTDWQASEKDWQESIYQENLYLTYKVSEMIETYLLFKDKKYIENITKKINETYFKSSPVSLNTINLDHTQDVLSMMKQILYRYETDNQRSRNTVY